MALVMAFSYDSRPIQTILNQIRNINKRVTGRGLINQGLIILRILLRAALRMMQILRRMDLVIVRKLSRKGRVIGQASRSTVHRKTQL